MIIFLTVLLGAGSFWVVWMAYRQWAFQPTGQIAYVCPGTRRDNNGYVIKQICLINADGSGRRQLTDLTDHASSPAWSSDGQRLVFKSGGHTAILNLVGASAIEYVDLKSDPTLFAKWSRWSPDGSQLIFVGLVSGQRGFDLYSADIDGSNVQKLVSDVHSAPAGWSPDGTRVAYTSDLGDTWIANHDGSNPQRMQEKCRFESWSPDGLSFVCISGFDMWIARTDGSGAIKVKGCFLISMDCANPRWSRNGQYLVYSQTDWRYFMSFGGEIWIMSADGVMSRLLVREHEAREPAWRP